MTSKGPVIAAWRCFVDFKFFRGFEDLDSAEAADYFRGSLPSLRRGWACALQPFKMLMARTCTCRTNMQKRVIMSSSALGRFATPPHRMYEYEAHTTFEVARGSASEARVQLPAMPN